MPKAFSVISWNVEHFKNSPGRVSTVVDRLAQNDPDVFALYEVEGKEVFSELIRTMPGYQFHITEGPVLQEPPHALFLRHRVNFLQLDFRRDVIRLKEVFHPHGVQVSQE